ncbi:hypothetical protein [Nostoc sp.]|uniref:hypothetical protein n=1 Tax=Nostoc sp. TaxID=1180 RepID=UPI002FF94F4A
MSTTGCSVTHLIPSPLVLMLDWGKFFISFLPPREIQQLGKIRWRSGVPGAGCDYLCCQCIIFMPVPGTTESSAAFPSCVNVHSSGFLLTIA